MIAYISDGNHLQPVPDIFFDIYLSLIQPAAIGITLDAVPHIHDK